jgi:hypothetical protein
MEETSDMSMNKCPKCGAVIYEDYVDTPVGRRKVLRVIQEIGKPLCEDCRIKISGGKT